MFFGGDSALLFCQLLIFLLSEAPVLKLLPVEGLSDLVLTAQLGEQGLSQAHALYGSGCAKDGCTAL